MHELNSVHASTMSKEIEYAVEVHIRTVST